MKIAIPITSGLLSPHFGHCEEFTIVDVDRDGGKVLSKQTVAAPPHEPGLLPKWLHEMGAEMIIAGGMGGRAQELFAQNDMDVIVGAPAASADEIVAAYQSGTLQGGANACDH